MATRRVTTFSVVTCCWAGSASCAGAGEAACPHTGAENISRHNARVALVTRQLQFVTILLIEAEELRRRGFGCKCKGPESDACCTAMPDLSGILSVVFSGSVLSTSPRNYDPLFRCFTSAFDFQHSLLSFGACGPRPDGSKECGFHGAG